MAKLKTSRYEVGRRSKAWLKVKIRREQEVIVVGYEPGKGARADLGSLILAVNEGKELRYVGEVGSGLTQRTIKQLKTELDAHRLDEPPVVNPPRIRGVRVVGATTRRPCRVQRMDRRRLPAPGRLQGARDRQGPKVGGPRARDVHPQGDAGGRKGSRKGFRGEGTDLQRQDCAESKSKAQLEPRRSHPAAPQTIQPRRLRWQALEALGKEGAVGDRRPSDQADEPRQGALSGRAGTAARTRSAT